MTGSDPLLAPSRDRSEAWIDLLRRLTASHPHCAVWKNAEDGLSGAGDVDLTAPFEHWPRVEEEFRRWAAEQELEPVFTCRHVPGSLYLAAVDRGASSFLQLDVRGEARLRGSRLFNAQDLAPVMEIDARGFRRLRPGAEGVLKLVLDGLGRGGRPRLEKIEKEAISDLLARDPSGVREAGRLFGFARRAVVAGATGLTGGRWNRPAMAIVEARALLKATMQPRALVGRFTARRVKKRCPLLRTGIVHGRRIPGDLEIWLTNVERNHELRDPSTAPRSGGPGGVISVVGPDGSGKSTLIDLLLRGVLRSVPVLNIRFPSVLPRRSANEGPVTEPHKNPPYSRLVSVAKSAYVLLDYLLGWFVRIRPFVRRGGWVVIQRGWWDMAVDPRRYRLHVPGRLLWAMGRIAPSPDLLLVLEAPPKVVFARKSELPPEEILRQTRSWREDLPASQSRLYLDATRTPAEIAHHAGLRITQLMKGVRRGAV